jgi:hypothetical protein
MTQIITIPARERLNYILIDSVKRALEFKPTGILRELTIKGDIPDSLSSSQIISIEESRKISVDRISPHVQYFITFKLTTPFKKHFVLLRGLLDLGGLKNINLTANKTDKTFHAEVLETQFEHFVYHIETILKFLIEEIKFKEGLRELINFEKNVKREHAMLFAKLQTSVV